MIAYTTIGMNDMDRAKGFTVNCCRSWERNRVGRLIHCDWRHHS